MTAVANQNASIRLLYQTDFRACHNDIIVITAVTVAIFNRMTTSIYFNFNDASGSDLPDPPAWRPDRTRPPDPVTGFALWVRGDGFARPRNGGISRAKPNKSFGMLTAENSRAMGGGCR